MRSDVFLDSCDHYGGAEKDITRKAAGRDATEEAFDVMAVWFLLGHFIAAPLSGDHLAHPSRFSTYARVPNSVATFLVSETACS